MYIVYVKLDEQGRVIAINSSAFLSSVEGWQEIDSGNSDKYHHAQGNYLTMPLFDDRGVFNYKLSNGAVVERTEEEKAADYTEEEAQPNNEKRIAALEAENKELKEALNALLEGALE